MEKVSITDLLSSLPEQQHKPIEKITQQLEDKNMKVKHISKKKQQQLLKKTNYQLAKEDLDKWVGIIKINREKDHLNFAEKNKQQANVSFFKNAPMNEFEKKIQDKLKSSNMNSAKTVMAQQQKILQQVDPQQAKRRLAQARKHRTMVFNEQIKRRRIAKIKSKLYRKIKKRQKLKEQGKKLAQMNSEEKNQYIEKLTKNRIKQRITLRHKTKNKHIMNLLRFSKSQKNVIQKSVNEVTDIRRNQLGKINEEILENMSEEYDDDNYKEQALKDLEKELEELQKEGDQLHNNEKKGLEGMRFMKAGNEKALLAQKNQGKRLLRALEGQQQEIQLSSEDQSQNKKQHKMDEQKEQQNQIISRKVYDTELAKNKETAQRENTVNADNYKNLRQYFLKENQAELLEGIDINKLKQKYQPNRIDMDLTDIINKNKEIFENFTNHAVNQNLKDFQQQKVGQIEANLMKDQPKKLKGWGSWTGPGIQEKKIDPKQELKKKLAKIQQIKKKRKDGAMSVVVINESRNKNLSQFMVRKLPHEYKSVQQFDYLQNQALGPEWNTMTQFQQSIKPKINVQKGTTIQPIKLPKKVQLLSRGKKN